MLFSGTCNVTQTQFSCEISRINAMSKGVGFYRMLPFPRSGKVDWGELRE